MPPLTAEDFEIDEDAFDLNPQPSHSLGYSTGPQPRSASRTDRLESRRYNGRDTLGEPVLATLLRDVQVSGRLLRSTLTVWRNGPAPTEFGEPADHLQHEWDLWGPLVFCLGMALCLSQAGPKSEVSTSFANLFPLIGGQLAMIALNVKLLGGTVSFLQALSLTGYSLFPIALAALVAVFVSSIIIRAAVVLPMVVWAIVSASRGLSASGVASRKTFLAVYPVGLIYTTLGWFCIIA